MKAPRFCEFCEEFFVERGFACSARSHGECYCPRCQGLCACTEDERAVDPNDPNPMSWDEAHPPIPRW